MKDVGLEPDQIQINGSGNKNATVQFKQDLSQAKDNQLSDKMKSEFGNSPQINTVSPLIGQELAKNAMLALVYAAGYYYLCIITFRMENGIILCLSFITRRIHYSRCVQFTSIRS